MHPIKCSIEHGRRKWNKIWPLHNWWVGRRRQLRVDYEGLNSNSEFQRHRHWWGCLSEFYGSSLPPQTFWSPFPILFLCLTDRASEGMVGGCDHTWMTHLELIEENKRVEMETGAEFTLFLIKSFVWLFRKEGRVRVWYRECGARVGKKLRNIQLHSLHYSGEVGVDSKSRFGA